MQMSDPRAGSVELPSASRHLLWRGPFPSWAFPAPGHAGPSFHFRSFRDSSGRSSAPGSCVWRPLCRPRLESSRWSIRRPRPSWQPHPFVPEAASPAFALPWWRDRAFRQWLRRNLVPGWCSSGAGHSTCDRAWSWSQRSSSWCWLPVRAQKPWSHLRAVWEPYCGLPRLHRSRYTARSKAHGRGYGARYRAASPDRTGCGACTRYGRRG